MGHEEARPGLEEAVERTEEDKVCCMQKTEYSLKVAFCFKMTVGSQTSVLRWKLSKRKIFCEN